MLGTMAVTRIPDSPITPFSSSRLNTISGIPTP
jgi:hypothetical protein